MNHASHVSNVDRVDRVNCVNSEINRVMSSDFVGYYDSLHHHDIDEVLFLGNSR